MHLLSVSSLKFILMLILLRLLLLLQVLFSSPPVSVLLQSPLLFLLCGRPVPVSLEVGGTASSLSVSPAPPAPCASPPLRFPNEKGRGFVRGKSN